MNDTLRYLTERRSIRFFTDETVPEDVIEAMIAAGHAAPTGTNRNRRYVVVTDPAFRTELLEKARPRYEAMMEQMPEEFRELRGRIDSVMPDSIYYNAPLIIFVVAGGATAEADANLVLSNIITAAESCGLGSCYVYFGSLPLDDEGVRTRMGLKTEESAFGPVVIGHPADQQPPAMPREEASVMRIG